MIQPPLPGPQLARRLVLAERDCYAAWADALMVSDGNSLRASSHSFGETRVVLTRGAVGASIVNRALGFTADDAQHLPEILALFERATVPVRIDVDPYGDGETLSVLARAGLTQVAFHQMLYGVPAVDDCAPADQIRIEPAGPTQAEPFAAIHEQVFGDGALITPLLNHPEFHCFLAYVNETPAALGVLHVRGGNASMANGITIPAYRRRGLQSALLRHRSALAAQLGCDLVISQASPRNNSLGNQVRVGLRIAGSKAVWGRSAISP
jgi:ribosomal protein S18 acetylase RimI-like enzyme